jgi:hypothetical protein
MEGVEVIAPPFVTSALDRGEWLASRPGRFTPEERTSGIHWIGGWVDVRAGLDALEKRKVLLLPGVEPRPVAIPTELSRLLF